MTRLKLRPGCHFAPVPQGLHCSFRGAAFVVAGPAALFEALDGRLGPLSDGADPADLARGPSGPLLSRLLPLLTERGLLLDLDTAGGPPPTDPRHEEIVTYLEERSARPYALYHRLRHTRATVTGPGGPAADAAARSLARLAVGTARASDDPARHGRTGATVDAPASGREHGPASEQADGRAGAPAPHGRTGDRAPDASLGLLPEPVRAPDEGAGERAPDGNAARSAGDSPPGPTAHAPTHTDNPSEDDPAEAATARSADDGPPDITVRVLAGPLPAPTDDVAAGRPAPGGDDAVPSGAVVPVRVGPRYAVVGPVCEGADGLDGFAAAVRRVAGWVDALPQGPAPMPVGAVLAGSLAARRVVDAITGLAEVDGMLVVHGPTAEVTPVPLPDGAAPACWRRLDPGGLPADAGTAAPADPGVLTEPWRGLGRWVDLEGPGNRRPVAAVALQPVLPAGAAALSGWGEDLAAARRHALLALLRRHADGADIEIPLPDGGPAEHSRAGAIAARAVPPAPPGPGDPGRAHPPSAGEPPLPDSGPGQPSRAGTIAARAVPPAPPEPADPGRTHPPSAGEPPLPDGEPAEHPCAGTTPARAVLDGLLLALAPRVLGSGGRDLPASALAHPTARALHSALSDYHGRRFGLAVHRLDGTAWHLVAARSPEGDLLAAEWGPSAAIAAYAALGTLFAAQTTGGAHAATGTWCVERLPAPLLAGALNTLLAAHPVTVRQLAADPVLGPLPWTCARLRLN